MEHTVATYEELRERFPIYQRAALMSNWRLWRAGHPFKAVICDHSTLREWDCYCSWGCNVCSHKTECVDCGSTFPSKKPEPSVRLEPVGGR